MSNEKSLKILSIAMLVLFVFDILAIAIGWDGGLFGTLSGGAVAFMIVIYAIIVIIALAKLYMGIAGLKYSKGEGKGTFHITLAKIGIVLAVLAMVVTLIEAIGTGGYDDLIGYAVDIIFMGSYYKMAKACL